MSKVRGTVSIVVALSALLLATVGSAQSARVMVVPASSVVEPGSVFSLDVRVADVVDLYGVDLGLAFDADVLEAQEVLAGSFLSPVFEAQKTLDNQNGELRYVFALMGPVPPVSGSGVLARITFRAVRDGQCALTFERLLLANDAAQPIPCMSTDGLITIGSITTPTSPTSTATGMPTRTNTPSVTRTLTAAGSPTATAQPTATPTEPTLEALALDEARRDLGWDTEVFSQGLLYKMQYLLGGSSAEAWIRRFDRETDAESAFVQERDELAAAGWELESLLFHECDAYGAVRGLQAAASWLATGERKFGFHGGFWFVGTYASGDLAHTPATDPEAVAEAVYQAGRGYGLFGPRFPRAYLPIILRAYGSAGPIASPTGTATTQPSPSHTMTASPEPGLTASPTPMKSATGEATLTGTVAATASPSVSPTSGGTPTASPTPLYEQLVRNPSFETDEDWIRQGGYPADYTVSRAHKGLRSMRVGVLVPYSGRVWSSVKQTVSIPKEVTEAQLSFYYFPVSSPVDSDRIYFLLKQPNTGVELEAEEWMERDQLWNVRTFDLREYAGQTVELWIGVYNDGQGVTTVYLDDVELWVYESIVP